MRGDICFSRRVAGFLLRFCGRAVYFAFGLSCVGWHLQRPRESAQRFAQRRQPCRVDLGYSWKCDRIRRRAITTGERFVLTFDPNLTSANYFAEYDKVWWRTVRQTAGWMYEYVIRNPQGPIWDALRSLKFAACSAGLCRQVLPHGDLVNESCTQNLADYLELKEIIISNQADPTFRVLTWVSLGGFSLAAGSSLAVGIWTAAMAVICCRSCWISFIAYQGVGDGVSEILSRWREIECTLALTKLLLQKFGLLPSKSYAPNSAINLKRSLVPFPKAK